MSSAEHKVGAASSSGSQAQSRHDLFCTDIANGLHALAQPLSILRSTLEMLALPEEIAVDRQRYVDLSVKHIRPACEIFAYVQGLIASEMVEPEQVSLDFMELLNPLLEERQPRFLEAGLKIQAPPPATNQRVLCEAERTEQAIAAVLDTVLSTSVSGDVVVMSLISSEDMLEFSVRTRHAPPKGINSRNRLNLSLARASTLSQHGEFRFTEDPLEVGLALPRCKGPL